MTISVSYKGTNWLKKPPFWGSKTGKKPFVLIKSLPLSVHKSFSKKQSQHLIWRGICCQMTPLNTKSEGSLRIIVLSNQHLHPPRPCTCYYEEVASVSSGLHKNASDSIDWKRRRQSIVLPTAKGRIAVGNFWGVFFVTLKGCKIFP